VHTKWLVKDVAMPAYASFAAGRFPTPANTNANPQPFY
jgi:hypothetical protein